MNSPRTLSRIVRAVWLTVGLWAGWMVYQSAHLPRPEPGKVASSTGSLYEPISTSKLPAEAWTVFQDSRQPSPVPSPGPAGTRFRLAGTFLSFSLNQDDEKHQEIRKAIIDDAGTQTQVLVQEGDKLASYTVETIRRDSVVLRNGAGESRELALSFSMEPAPAQAKGPSILKPKTFEDMPALETSRFGKRIGDNRWVLQREELMAYYQELLEEPARMASLFASLPDFTEDGSLSGFQVQIVGEKELFDAMGLKEGDIIREVNSIRMSSPRRSEYLVKEFIQGRLNAVVFDVERGGERQKLIELFR